MQATDAIQSGYFRTTDVNRRFGCGFAEFDLPTIPDLFRAVLRFNECRGWSGFPIPADVHELSYYSAADLQVTADDYSRPTTALTTVETDVNNEVLASFSVDVTAMVAAHQGSAVGLRFKLTADPTELKFGSSGSAFCGVGIDAVTLVDAPLQLIWDLELLNLDAGLHRSFVAKLESAHAALQIGHYAAACGVLRGVFGAAEAQSTRPGAAISPIDAANLLGVIQSMRDALGCVV